MINWNWQEDADGNWSGKAVPAGDGIEDDRAVIEFVFTANVRLLHGSEWQAVLMSPKLFSPLKKDGIESAYAARMIIEQEAENWANLRFKHPDPNDRG